ncbi:MAG: DUF1467 family protein [Gemmobacter sp.]
MTITGGAVLFMVIWFMTFFVILPLRLTTQGDAGEVVPGTPPAAPAGHVVLRKAKLATFWALGIWAVIAAVILSEVISVRDLDVLGTMGPRN